VALDPHDDIVDLAAARRARRLAWELERAADRDRALAFAAELEAQADALEKEAANRQPEERCDDELGAAYA
jgi:hypothetical protein